MSYEISDTGSSIRFNSEQGFFFLMKRQIKSIRYVRDNMICIDSGNGLHSIYIQAHHVTQPENYGADHLAQILDEWVNTQDYPEPPIDGPVE